MAKFLVKTPVLDYAGSLGGVVFSNGQAIVDGETHPAELAYCQDRYVVEPYVAEEPTDAEEPEDAMPRKSASKADWAAYAVAQGMTAEEADSLNRDQLVAHFTKENDQ
jgi:hypothetical protein